MSKQHKQAKSKRLAWATLAMAAALGMGQAAEAAAAQCGTIYATTLTDGKLSSLKASNQIASIDISSGTTAGQGTYVYPWPGITSGPNGLGTLAIGPDGTFLSQIFNTSNVATYNPGTAAKTLPTSVAPAAIIGHGTDNFGNVYFMGGTYSTSDRGLYLLTKGSFMSQQIALDFSKIPEYNQSSGGDISIAPDGSIYLSINNGGASGASAIYRLDVNGSSATSTKIGNIAGVATSGLAFDNQGNAYTTTNSSTTIYKNENVGRLTFTFDDNGKIVPVTTIPSTRLTKLFGLSSGVLDLASCVASTITVNKALYKNDPVNRIDTDQFTVSVRDGNTIVNDASGSYVNEAGKTISYNSTSATDTANPIKGMSDYKKLNPFDSNATTITGTTGMYQFVGTIKKSYNIGETMADGTAIVDYKSSLYCQNRLPVGLPPTGKGGTAVAYLNGDVTSTIRTNGNIVLPPLAAWDGFVCNFVNKPTTLAVTKVVDNTAGGTLTAKDWTLTAESSNTKQTKLSKEGQIVKTAIRNGAYTISEAYNGNNAALASNYSPTYECKGTKIDLLAGTSTTYTVKGTQSGSGINTTYQFVVGDGKDDVAIGDDVSCTVKNTYTPPVVPNPPLTCKDNMYGVTGAVQTYVDINPISTSAVAKNSIWNLGPDSNSTAAALGVTPDGKKLFVAQRNGKLLLWKDVTTGKTGSIAIPSYNPNNNDNSSNILRMAIAPDGTGYMTSGKQLWAFTTDDAPVFLAGYPKTLQGTFSSGVSTNGNGDIVVNSAGEIFLFMSPFILETPNFIDIFKIKADGTSYYYGRVKDTMNGTTINGHSFGGVAALGNDIYMSDVSGAMIKLDLSTLKATTSGTGTGTSDLTSCVYLPLTPEVKVTKSVAKVAGSNGSAIIPGDTLEYTIIYRNSGTVSTVQSTFQDDIPGGTKYVAGTTTLNTTAVTDDVINNISVMPFVKGASINSPGADPGIVEVDNTPNSVTSGPKDTTNNEAVIKFKVTVLPGATSIINQGTITYLDNPPGGIKTDDPGTPTPNDPTIVNVSPNIALKKYVLNTSISGEKYKFTGSGLPGNVLQYCIAYYSSGGDAKNFTITDVFPDNTKDWKNFIYIPSSNTPDGTVPSNPAANPNDAAPVINPSNPDWTTLNINTRPTGTTTPPAGITYGQVNLPAKDANGNTIQKPGITLAFDDKTILPGNSKGAICFDATIK